MPQPRWGRFRVVGLDVGVETFFISVTDLYQVVPPFTRRCSLIQCIRQKFAPAPTLINN